MAFKSETNCDTKAKKQIKEKALYGKKSMLKI